MFPNRRVVLCFQPHQHSRTKELLDEFVEAMKTADAVVVPEIYAVAGRTEGDDVSSEDLVAKIPGAAYAKDLDGAESVLRDVVKEGDVLIVQGAGDVDDLARRLAA